MQDYTAIVTENKVKWCDVELDNDNIRIWDAVIYGPEGTGYEGGEFHVIMDFEHKYNKPQIKMKTFIFHVNVDPPSGYICLKYMTDPDYLDVRRDGALILLQEIYDLMKNPIPEVALNIDALILYCEDRKGYEAGTKMFTEMYAIEKKQNNSKKGKDDVHGDNNADEKKDAGDNDTENDDSKAQ